MPTVKDFAVPQLRQTSGNISETLHDRHMVTTEYEVVDVLSHDSVADCLE